MVNFAVPVLALAMVVSVTAAPAPTTSDTLFSFSSWVEDIIANPDTALSPEEAIREAAKAAAVRSAGGLEKRANCNNPFADAWAPDAVQCVNDLARKGQNGVQCGIPASLSTIQMCRIGNARIVASRGVSGGDVGANCNDVARTAGIIFDHCYRADQTVKGSETCITNNQMQVNIAGV